jgi:hypothetical protein
MKKLFLCLIVGLIFNVESEAQIIFASNYLESLYESLPSDCRFVPGESLFVETHSVKTNSIINSRAVTLNYYLDGNVVEDIGVAILDSASRSLFQSENVCRFVERKILELLLIAKDNSFTDKTQENKISIELNRNSVLNKNMLQKAYAVMIDKSDFKLKRDSLNYQLTWIKQDKEEVAFSFPASNTLIRSKDKKELDEELIRQLKNFHYIWSDKEKFSSGNISINDLKLLDSVYYQDGEIFYIKEINNNCYYKSGNGELQFIFEPKNLTQSLCNYIQFPLLNPDKNIRLKHKVYGNKEFFYSMKFSDMLGYFKNDFTLYTGIESRTEKGVKAIVIMLNKKLNYIHLLAIDLNDNDLFDKNTSLTASFITNIPTDNIQNLFGNYLPKQNQFKLPINE